VRILVAAPGPAFNAAAVERAVQAALTAAGAAALRVTVSVTDTIPSGAAGKRPLVITHRPKEPHK
jgi:hypothetical protein